MLASFILAFAIVLGAGGVARSRIRSSRSARTDLLGRATSRPRRRPAHRERPRLPPSTMSQFGTAPDVLSTACSRSPSWLDARRRLSLAYRLLAGAEQYLGRVPDAGRAVRQREVRSATSASTMTAGLRPPEYQQRGGRPRSGRASTRDVAAAPRRSLRPVRARRAVHAVFGLRFAEHPELHAALRRHPALQRDVWCRGRVHRRPGVGRRT